MFKVSASVACVSAGLLLASLPASAAWTGAANSWLSNPAVFAGGSATLAGNYVYNDSVATLSGSQDFFGLNSSGDEAVMTFDYSSSAQATATTLKAKAAASLTNGFYNANNPAYFLGFDEYWSPVVNYSGVPTVMESSGTAFYQKTVSVAGDANLAYITFDVVVDGSVSSSLNSSVSTYAYLDFYTNGVGYTLADQTNATFNSGRFNVSNGTAHLTAMLLTSVRFNLEGAESFSMSLIEGSVDFFSTATIGKFYGFDAAGRAVDLASVSLGNGQNFETVRVAAIPEPETLALFALGLGVIGAWSRKHRAAHSAT